MSDVHLAHSEVPVGVSVPTSESRERIDNVITPFRESTVNEHDEDDYTSDNNKDNDNDIMGLGGLSPKARHSLGLFLLLVLVLLWVTSNFMTFSIFGDGSYAKPVLVCYLNTSGFTLYLVPYAVNYLWNRKGRKGYYFGWCKGFWGRNKNGNRYGKRKGNRDRNNRYEYSAVPTSFSPSGPVIASEDSNEQYDEINPEDEEDGRKLQKDNITFTTLETLKLSAQFCLIWFIANYFAAACFAYTTPSSGTILSSTSLVWTLMFSSIFGVEKFTLRKLFAVAIALIGVILISTVDINTSNLLSITEINKVLLGDFFAILGAFLYAFYTVLLKFRVSDEGNISMTLFFGFVGLINLIFILPVIFLFDYLGIEELVWPPPSPYITKILLGNALITVVSDMAWAYAMFLTTPLVVTVGLGLTIPLAMLGQMVIYGWKMAVWDSVKYVIGAACVAGGFLGVTVRGGLDGT